MVSLVLSTIICFTSLLYFCGFVPRYEQKPQCWHEARRLNRNSRINRSYQSRNSSLNISTIVSADVIAVRADERSFAVVQSINVGDCETGLEHGLDDLEGAHSNVGVEGGACEDRVVVCWETGGEDGWVVGEGPEGEVFVGDDFLESGGVDWDGEPCCLC